MNEIYLIFSLLIIFITLMTINFTNPMYSVFWLVLLFIIVSGFLILIGFDFIPLLIILIYVGALAILFLFVIMMLDIFQLNSNENINNITPIILITLSLLISRYYFTYETWKVFQDLDKIDNFEFLSLSFIQNISILLYSEFWLYFILISLLLLIAMFGVIILNLEKPYSLNQHLIKQHHRNNSWI